MRERVLAWDGCLNVRDLGGLPTGDGSTTHHGRVVRADSVRQLTDRGWEAALAHGVRTVLDLRLAAELQDDSPGDVPVDVVHLSVLGEQDASRWEKLERRLVGLDALDEKVTVYLESLETNRREFAQAIAVVADAPEGCVLVHCAGGKDRTGLVCALLLRLAGVPVGEVAADYALSERFLAPRHERWLAEATDDAHRERIRRVSATPAEAMRRVLAELEERHGGVAGYVLGGEADDAVVRRARARLLH